jgi:hypothetical protein
VPDVESDTHRGQHALRSVRLRYRWFLLAVGLMICSLGVWLMIQFGPPGPVDPDPLGRRLRHFDCFLKVETTAWVDHNSNGLRDPDDGPLRGVKYEVIDVYGGARVMGSPQFSDSDGRASIEHNLPGCPDTDLEIRAIAPEGFQPTTSASLPVDDDDEYTFGFARQR